MNEKTGTILRTMIARHIIGEKHLPEMRLMKRITHLPKNEQNAIRADWEYCIKQLQWVLRMKKTGEWHVSLNPKKLSEVEHAIKNGE
ncbi:MAG TPA: hypothetical protein VJH88_06285 [Candidatus Nanoarchaeia archaeon]|nr:hypothetical protein [Candidatus Nanoarchaeia archaeon]